MLLKWVGGKNQYSNLVNEFPKCQDYYEPFLGGGSVLLRVVESHLVSGKVYASDINESLISFWKWVQRDPESLIREVESIGTVDETRYYELREEFNSCTKESLRCAALFVTLNKTCFRGVYREGPRGFNVPYGHYKNPKILDPHEVRRVSQLLKNVTFSVRSFETIEPTENDFVYLDPPYYPVDEKSFTGYTYKSFNFETFLNFCKNLKCNWVMSNSDVQLLKDSFPGMYTRVLCRRSIHSKDPSSTAYELLIKSLKATNSISS